MNSEIQNTIEIINKEDEKVPSILFIDDEQAILSAIKSLLRKEKYDQYYFTNAREALDFLRDHHVDLIVADLRMDGMTGEQFLRHSQSYNSKAIRIILSAYEEKSLVLDLLSKGFAQFYILKPWDDEGFKKLLKKFTDLHNKLERNNLIDYLHSFSDLPYPTSFNSDMLNLFSDDVSVKQITEHIERYPFIVTKLIQIVNSVSFSSYRAITSVRDAIILMGIEPLRVLLLSLGILNKFQTSLNDDSIVLMNDIWDRSLQRGILAKKIALLWDKPYNKGIVFISSLVLDIGFLVWLYTETDKYKEFIEQMKTEERILQQVEEEFFKYPHNKLGATLLELWNFPFDVVNIVRNHHGNSCGNEVIKIMQLSEILEGSFPNIQHDKLIDNLIPYYKEKLIHG